MNILMGLGLLDEELELLNGNRFIYLLPLMNLPLKARRCEKNAVSVSHLLVEYPSISFEIQISSSVTHFPGLPKVTMHGFVLPLCL